ncbi:unnamed protein product [Acanthoscelides obtectus]|uniref:Uncharacterized protein n=1 Tax=Acanthoscelides obtectus TaxID=200917 RepID=A0A9P0PP82_ACAOB|nr:unnamed protein product [Acanthoscelides obtectus]CAK1674291.1 hypothetical protein AOBTE_LOCUS29581 [Acanthoscelides obtectus]
MKWYLDRYLFPLSGRPWFPTLLTAPRRRVRPWLTRFSTHRVSPYETPDYRERPPVGARTNCFHPVSTSILCLSSKEVTTA